MANASVSFDGTRVNDADALGSIWTDLGGGKCADEPDFIYQGNQAISEKVGTAEGGVALDMVATVDYTTPNVWIAKHIATNSAALNNLGATGGILEIGSGGRRADYDRYYVVGGDTYPLQGGWLITPIDPNGGNQSARPGTAPTLTAIDYYGWACDFGATSKAENVAMDAVDYIPNGKGLTCTDGIGGTDGTFALFATTDEDASGNNRWGIVSTREGILYVTGVLTIGDSGTGAEFTDSGAVVVWPDALFLNSLGFFGLDLNLQNASTVISITNCVFISRGTAGGTVDTRAVLEVIGTSGSAALDGCIFQNMADVILTSGAALDGCVIETVAMTQGTAEIQNSTITTASATSVATLQDPTFGTTSGIHDTEFVQGGAGHAIELSTVGATVTLTNITWTGYGADTTDSAAIDVTAGSGTTTINWAGGNAPTYKSAGATVVVQSSVTITYVNLQNGSEVRVYNTGTSTEADGIESVTGGEFAATLQASTGYDVVVIHRGSLPIRRINQSYTATGDIDLNQLPDANFSDP